MTASPLSSLRILVGAVGTAPVIIVVLMGYVLSDTIRDPLPWPYLGIVVTLGVALAILISRIGYRVAPLPRRTPRAEAEARSRTAYQSRLYLRLAAAEIPMLVAVVLAFVTRTGGFAVVLFGAGMAINLIFTYAWPSERSIARTAEALESAGARSHLREALGVR